MSLFDIAKIMWAATGVFWLLSALSVKRSAKKENSFARLLYLCFWIVGFTMLFTNDFRWSFLYKPFLFNDQSWKITGIIFTAAGLLYAVWARSTLGKNWSGKITIKEDHELIKKGPYAITRHPIYSGFMLSFIGCILIEGLAKDCLAFFILLAGILMKIYREERFMREAFGEKYLEYAKKVKGIVPFVI